MTGYRNRLVELWLNLVDRVRPRVPVRNAARRPTGTHLPWGETAALTEPGHRHPAPAPGPGGQFRTPTGVFGRSSYFRDDHPGRAEHQEALAAEDERMHGEINSILPGVTVRAFRGDRMTTPSVHGSTTAGIAVLRKRLAAAGYELNEANRDVTNVIYNHPEGHRIILGSHPSTGRDGYGRSWSRRRVEYHPDYGPDAADPMSRAADAASLTAHIKTGAAESAVPGLANHAALLDAAAHHAAAATAHLIARDKAEEEGRAGDAGRHVRAAGYHEAVARSL